MICHGDFYTNLLRRLAALFVGAVQSVVDIFVSCSPFTSGKFPSIFVVGSPFALTQVKKKTDYSAVTTICFVSIVFVADWYLLPLIRASFDCLPIASRCFSTYQSGVRDTSLIALSFAHLSMIVDVFKLAMVFEAILFTVLCNDVVSWRVFKFRFYKHKSCCLFVFNGRA
jgi:hypothetical protein